MNKKTMKMTDKVVSDQFGIDTKVIRTKPVRESIVDKVNMFRGQDADGQLVLHTMEVTQHEELQRSVANYFSGEFQSIVKTLTILENIPSTFKRETLRFFNNDFAGFDAGASSAVGRFIKSGIEWVKEDPDAVNDKGRGEQLNRYVMKGVKERSRAKYFVEMRKDWMEYERFNRKMLRYCELVWGMVTVEENTYTSDMPLIDRVRNRDEHSRSLLEKFIKNTCSIKRGGSILTEDLYGQYEGWSMSNGYGMLGRGSFVETITKLIPSVRQEAIGGAAYIRGLELINEAKNQMDFGQLFEMEENVNGIQR